MSDSEIRRGASAALSVGPEVLLGVLGLERLAKLQKACEAALSGPLATAEEAAEARRPFVDPAPGDMVVRTDYEYPRFRVVTDRVEVSEGKAYVYYHCGPWDDRREPNTRRTLLKTWRAWCNHVQAEVLRAHWQPEACQSVWRKGKDKAVTCDQAGWIVGSLTSALEELVSRERIDNICLNGCLITIRPSFPGSMRRGECSACRRNREVGRSVCPEPQPVRLYLRGLVDQIKSTWEDNPHFPEGIFEELFVATAERLDSVIGPGVLEPKDTQNGDQRHGATSASRAG